MDIPLTNAEWRAFQDIPDQGYSHRAWVDHKIQERVEALVAENERLRERQESHDLANAAIEWKGKALDAQDEANALRAQLNNATTETRGNVSTSKPTGDHICDTDCHEDQHGTQWHTFEVSE